MPRNRKNALLICLDLVAGAILAVLLVAEFRHDQFSDCMSIGAFSRQDCADYATE